MLNDLRRRISEFDGRDTSILEAVRDESEPSDAALGAVVDLAADENAKVAAGATWLFRAWVEGGATPRAPRVRALARTLPAVSDHWARQHICQAVAGLRIPEDCRESFAEFLREACASERPFLRAWGTDGLHRLAAQHAEYRHEADAQIAAAMGDSKPSVRARARGILGER